MQLNGSPLRRGWRVRRGRVASVASLQPTVVAIVSLALVAIGGVCCDHGDHPPDEFEYHGEPSTVICGVRWSLDNTSVGCDHGAVRVADLQGFTRMNSLQIVDATVVGSGDMVHRGLSSLGLVRASLQPEDAVVAFPGLRGLWIDASHVPLAALRQLPDLRYLTYIDSASPSAAELAALCTLEQASFIRVPGGAEIGRELVKLRPDLEIRVDGKTISVKGRPAPRPR
ncbi:MAG: hypothetical protein H6709_13510 [Kofleriaceae bacterium]|nr:hypothetical protein [Myxococcales bacterium]MCB9561926.1 hypothetical protein [Kofleriaceae bacterium]MCB9573095.1 hypothetical protein [Kofleriaceae bacterium]